MTLLTEIRALSRRSATEYSAATDVEFTIHNEFGHSAGDLQFFSTASSAPRNTLDVSRMYVCVDLVMPQTLIPHASPSADMDVTDMHSGACQ